MIIISTFNLLIHSLLHQKRISSLVSIEKTVANFYEKQNQFTEFEKELKEFKQLVLSVIDFE